MRWLTQVQTGAVIVSADWQRLSSQADWADGAPAQTNFRLYRGGDDELLACQRSRSLLRTRSLRLGSRFNVMSVNAARLMSDSIVITEIMELYKCVHLQLRSDPYWL